MSQTNKIKRNSIILMVIFSVIFGAAIINKVFSPKKIPPQAKEYFRKIEFKTFGGPAAEIGWDVASAKDGGFVICGDTRSFGAGGADVYLVKTDANGEMEWARTFGDSGDEAGMSVVTAADGGYVIAGGTKSFGNGETDMYIIKVDADGDCVWSRTIGGKDYDYAYSVKNTSDKGFIVAGYSSAEERSDAYVIKLDSSGKTQWEKKYGDYGWELAYSAVEDNDKGYIICGYTTSTINAQSLIYLVKTDANGNSKWARTYGGARENRGYYALPDKDGGYVVASKTTSYISKGVGWDMMAFKIDAKGNSLWTTFVPAADTDIGKTVLLDGDKKYVLGATKRCYGICDTDMCIERVDAAGNTSMIRIYSGTGNDTLNSILKDKDGNYIICGTTTSAGNGRSDMMLMKVGPDGEQVW